MAMNVALSSFGVPVPGGHLYLNDIVICLAAILFDPVAAFMVGGYFVFETILYGAGTAALSLIGNATQGACGLVIAAVLVNVLSSNKKIRGLSGLEKRG